MDRNDFRRHSGEMMHMRARVLSLALAMLFVTAAAANVAASRGKGGTPAMVRLPGHVLSALAHAEVMKRGSGAGAHTLTLTIVLKRDNQAAFESYLHSLYEPQSPNFHRFLTQRQI